jgi:hypothetical protein
MRSSALDTRWNMDRGKIPTGASSRKALSIKMINLSETRDRNEGNLKTPSHTDCDYAVQANVGAFVRLEVEW